MNKFHFKQIYDKSFWFTGFGDYEEVALSIKKYFGDYEEVTFSMKKYFGDHEEVTLSMKR